MLDWHGRIAELKAAVARRDEQLAAVELKYVALHQEHVALQQKHTALQAQVVVLTRRVAELTEALNQNSRNSHKPPSSDGPGQRNTRAGKGSGKTRKKSGRKRGAQPGHKGSHRQLVPAEQVDEFVHHYPVACENCWDPLPEVPDVNPTRFQVTEVPPIVAHVTEHQLHTVTCGCGHRTRATEHEMPASAFGPRLMALVALLTGIYHVSRRKTVRMLSEMVGVRISLGSVSAIEHRVSTAIEPTVETAWNYVDAASVKHADATGWLVAGITYSLWTLASKAATVFRIFANGKRTTIEPFFGKLVGILVSDRASVFGFWAMKQRQVCFAHLIRRFVSFSERDGPAKVIGDELLDLTALVFDYWHGYRDGKLDKKTFLAWMAPVQRQFEAVLERAAGGSIDRLSGSCADILAHRLALWTFVHTADVEPSRVDAWRGDCRMRGVAVADGFRPLSVSQSVPWFRFQAPLIEPDVRY